MTTGIKYWQVARLLGISQATLCRRLRDELPDEEQQRIVDLIQQSAQDGEQHDDC